MDTAIAILTACGPSSMELAALVAASCMGKPIDPEQVRISLENFHKAAGDEVAKIQATHDAVMKAAAEALAQAQDTTLPK